MYAYPDLRLTSLILEGLLQVRISDDHGDVSIVISFNGVDLGKTELVCDDFSYFLRDGEALCKYLFHQYLKGVDAKDTSADYKKRRMFPIRVFEKGEPLIWNLASVVKSDKETSIPAEYGGDPNHWY